MRIFGSLYYPCLIPLGRTKLDFKSTRCVFIGYSSRHKGYQRYDLSTGKVIISRHVVFDETNFSSPSQTPGHPSHLKSFHFRSVSCRLSLPSPILPSLHTSSTLTINPDRSSPPSLSTHSSLPDIPSHTSPTQYPPPSSIPCSASTPLTESTPIPSSSLTHSDLVPSP